MDIITEIVTFALVSFFLITGYQIFLSDWFEGKAEVKRVKKAKLNSVSKMAMIKMVSDDPKDIETFVSSNVEYLSDQTVRQFVDRIETLKADSVIKSCDNILKQRIEDISDKDKQEKKKVNLAKSSR